MDIIFSEEFKKEFGKIKDRATLEKIAKQLLKLKEQPEAGKPLRHELKNH